MARPGSAWVLHSFSPFPVRHPGADHGTSLTTTSAHCWRLPSSSVLPSSSASAVATINHLAIPALLFQWRRLRRLRSISISIVFVFPILAVAAEFAAEAFGTVERVRSSMTHSLSWFCRGFCSLSRPLLLSPSLSFLPSFRWLAAVGRGREARGNPICF